MSNDDKWLSNLKKQMWKAEKKRIKGMSKKELRKEIKSLNDAFDALWEEKSEDGLRRLDLEQAIEKLLAVTVWSGEFGTYCTYCSASSPEFVKMLIHDNDCAITNAIRVLARQEKPKSEQENTP